MTSARTAAVPARLHALDAVRAFALLLGIALHSAMSFVPGIGNYGWPIVDNSPSPFLALMLFVIHIFRMTLFFFIAGFFARVVYQRAGGVRGFAANRGKRIVLPLAVGWIVMVPLLFVILSWAARRQGMPLVLEPPSGHGGAVPFPLGHLWFLWLLVQFYVCAIALRWMLTRIDAADIGSGRYGHALDGIVRGIAATPLGAAVLAVPAFVSLYTLEGWIPWTGIPAPDHTLIPNLPAFVSYGAAFGLGWLLHRQTKLLRNFKSQWAMYSVATVALTVVAIASGAAHVSAQAPQGATRIVFAAAYCAAAWCWTFALTGAALRFLSAHNPRVRYLADASYWSYLTHLPIVFALQAAMMTWEIHWAVKFALIVSVTTTALLASYRWMVRGTVIGAVLNGVRHPPAVHEIPA